VRNETRDRPTPVERGSAVSQDRPAGCLLRLFWMAFGNFALLFLSVLIFKRDDFSALDAVYWALVMALGSARYADIARFDGLTTSGEPATMEHFRRYSVGLFVGAAALWACTHVLRLIF
jgi:hypothetical protein